MAKSVPNFIHYVLAYCFFFVCQTCPYKNLNENLLKVDNFYQTIQFQRNFFEEEKGASFGFHFWIFSEQYENKYVMTNFKDPFVENQNIDGNLILTVEEEELERFLIMSENSEDFQNFHAITFDNDIIFDQTLNYFNSYWDFVLIIIQPLNHQLILQYQEEDKYLIFPLKLLRQIISINLGGLKKVQRKYNLNSFKGRLTKLEIINYFFYSQNTYTDFKYFCIIPQKFIQGFGVYLLNETSCQIGCLECEQNNEINKCLVKDSEFQNYYFDNGQILGCYLTFEKIGFYIQSIFFFICIDLQVSQPQIQLIEAPQTYELNCLFGYFHVDYNNNNFCIQCPYKTSKMIECIECLSQNNLWYLQPICKSDFVKVTDLPNSLFKLFERSAENYEYFIIDDTLQLVHIIGVSQFCKEEESLQDCFLLKYKHFSQIIYAKCLSNYYEENGGCFQEDSNCENLIQKGNCNFCKMGTYLYKGICYNCSNNCRQCRYNDEIGDAVCIVCIKYFTVIQSKCQQCGLFCLQCVEELDEFSNTYFPRCLICLDEQKYFLSFDGINCLENTIINCQYAFQSVKGNIMLSTLDYQFQRQQDLNNVETLCSRCFDFYVFIFPLKKCIKYNQEQCLFGYSLQVYDSEKLEENSFNILFEEEKLLKVSQIQCLIYNNQGSECSKISHCLKCLFSILHKQYICIQCQIGYYIDRFSQKCYLCDLDFCISCYHQNKVSKDFWKLNALPFYFNFIQKIYSHSFFRFAQSQEQNDYEVACYQCTQGGNLYKNKCYQSEDFCFKKELINNEYICTDCESFPLTLENNQCRVIQAIVRLQLILSFANQRFQLKMLLSKFFLKYLSLPYALNIALFEIQQYNPYFKKETLNSQSSVQCFKPRNIAYSYYDSEIHQFINCKNFLEGCEKHIIIQKELTCPWDDEQDLFLRNLNIFDENQITNNYIRESTAKKIILKLSSLQLMTCKLSEQKGFKQNFAKANFLLKNVELEINCFHQVIWEIENNLILRRFQNIKINGLYIKIIENSSKKKFEFKSFKNLQITFNNVTFWHQTQKPDHFQFCFFNATNIKFVNTLFQDFKIPSDFTFFYIENAQGNVTIQFQNISFQNLNLQDSSLISVISQYVVRLICQNFEFIRGSIKNSTFILRNIKQIKGEVKLSNLSLQYMIIRECSSFFYFQTFYQVFINEFYAFENTIADSNLITLSLENYIYNLNIDSCIILFESVLIKQVNIGLQWNKIFQFKNISYQLNQYSQLSKFIFIQQHNSYYSEFLLKNFTFHKNLIYANFNNLNLMNINSTIIFLDLSNIEISEIYIQRSSGLNQFFFQNVKILTIQNMIITQKNDEKLLGIHESFECFNKNNKKNLYGISLFIYLAEYVSIKNLTVIQAQSQDYPIFFFISDSLAIRQQTVNFSSIFFENSLFVQTLPSTKAALIFIQSNSELIIIVENSIFNSNILKVYCNETMINSAVIFNVNAKHSKFLIQSSSFTKNIVLDGDVGMFYVESSTIYILNCTFYLNNIMIYEVVQPYLMWTFNNQQKIYLEQIKSLLKIQSLYGLGYFLTKQINITNSNFEVCQGSIAFLYLNIIAEGKVQFQYLQFFSNESNLNLDTQFGPIIYIDGALSQRLEVDIQSINAKQIYSNQKGGILYVSVKEGSSNILLKNINITNAFADGALIYYQNIKSIIDQNIIKISNIIYAQSDKEQEIYFLNKQYSQGFVKKQIKLLGQNNTLIYISNANIVKISELRLEDLFFKSALVIKEAITIQLISISISKGVFNERVILIIPHQTLKVKIFIENLKVFNIMFGKLQIQNQEENTHFPLSVQFRCDNDQNITAPNILDYFYPVQQQVKKINFSIIDDPLSSVNKYGLIHLKQLNYLHQIKINNLEFQNITCSLCKNGLVQINFTHASQILQKQEINNLIVINSKCGYNGCINIFTSSSENIISTQNVLANLEFFVQNYVCQLNEANDGTCLFLENVRIIISKSAFRFNKAFSSGGAIYLKQSDFNNQLVIENTLIQNNKALIGGGIFMDEQQELNFEKLGTVVSSNEAQYFANDVSAIPSKLLLKIGQIQDDLFEIQTIKSNQTYKLQVQKLNKPTLQNGFKANFTILPTGMPIFEYRYFDWRNRVYVPLNITMRIIALTGLGMEIKNLKESQCQIKSRIIQLLDQKEIQILNGTFTSFTKVDFNDKTQNYNLDNISIYKREDLNDDEILELEFWCSSIFVPVYNKYYPYNLLSQHNQYFLRFQIKAYPCQLGEIRNETFQQCLTCRSQEGFFQLKLNQTYCLIRDQVSTIEVQPAMLNLRIGYWRPYFDTSEVSECYNYHQNCKGGWIEGDTSCNIGNLGALCEQCDLYNIRGDGQFASNKKYSCKKCQQLKSDYFYFAFKFLWILISISISASNNIQSVNERVEALKLQMIGFKICFQQNSKALLFKILINYFQIINSISTFQIDYNFVSQYALIFQNQTSLPNSIDCIFPQISDFEIHYLKILWSLAIPFIYFSFFCSIYGFISFFKSIPFHLSFITTTIIYLYSYFSPILVGDLINLVSYRYISGYYWTSSNMAYRYDTHKNLSWIMYLGIPSLTIIVLIIPAYLLRQLFKNRLYLDSKTNRQLLGFLYNEFKSKAYFWEILKILQKFILIFFLAFYQEETLFKGGMQLLILILYSALSLQYKPYLTHQYNKLDYISSQVCLYSITLSLGIFESQKQNIIYLRLIFLIILIIINLNFAIKLILQILIYYILGQKNNYFMSQELFYKILLRLFPFFKSIKYFQKIEQKYHLKQIRIQSYYLKMKKYIKQKANMNINNISFDNGRIA